MNTLISMQLLSFVLGTFSVAKFLLVYSSGRKGLNLTGITCMVLTTAAFLVAFLM